MEDGIGETSSSVRHNDYPPKATTQSDGEDIFEYTGDTVCKPMLDHFEQVLTNRQTCLRTLMSPRTLALSYAMSSLTPKRFVHNIDTISILLLFVILAGSKYRFTSEITSYSLRPTDLLLNNWFKVQLINLSPSLANEKVGPLVQHLDSVFKGTTYLLSKKWVGVNSILHPMSLAIHSILSLKWEAYWASDDELPSPMQI
ncbi:hypothetical protein E5676_scaffold306G00480 [Cucumis melo var. makuwa]|uniref:Uncharacterized protein n=1 Tax=Cucumis melo var. makuwa TaxID=1194695 RepID=A0A5A7TBI3_CUCMM|nr:hypothetical protein E6C27_scaffold333G00440 [Cucumis melo var. makuwa]TYK17800.1 hypothetical protein E5676_scaffold306G00480 [Cucumis melo var. makuwa]